MSFIQEKWDQGFARATELHQEHVNPQMMKVLHIIGFRKNYVKALGCDLWDEDGNQYLDFIGGYSVFSLGHNCPEVIETLRDVLGSNWPSMIQMDAPPLSAILSEELIKHDPTGRLQYCYFGSSGTESTEAALKFAKASTKRPRLLSFKECFHGLTMGSLSLIGNDYRKEGFGPFLPGCDVIPYGDTDALEKELKKKDVAGLIVEPIQGEGGVRELSQGQWDEIQRLCRKYGTLLILDEVQNGLGRTGKFFAFEHWNIEPDLVCLSKALTNGMVPCSVTLGTKEVFQGVYSRLERCVAHSSTWSENNLAMAAALASLDQIERKKLVQRSAEMGRYVKSKLEVALKEFDLVKEVRGRGLMFGVEFHSPDSIKLKMAWALVNKASRGLFGQMMTMSLLTKHRILTQVAGHNLNVLKLSPPLIVTEAQLDHFVTSLTSVMKECYKFPGGIWDFGIDLAKRSILPASMTT